MKNVLTDEELSEMTSLIEEVADKKIHTAPIVAILEHRFEDIFKQLAKGGRTPALWVQYHYMVETSSSVSHLQTTGASVLHCYKDAGHILSCWASSVCQGCKVVL